MKIAGVWAYYFIWLQPIWCEF